MKAYSCFQLGVLIFLVYGNHVSHTTARGINGGMTCATCTVLCGLIEQLAEVHNETVSNAFDRLCSYLPGNYGTACKVFISIFGAPLIHLLNEKETPDVVCHSLHLCHIDPGQKTCHLFPLPKHGMHNAIKKHRSTVKTYLLKAGIENFDKFIDPCNLPIIKDVCELLKEVFENHHPIQDKDKDGYSVIRTLRGSSWRGKDCDDVNSNIYPGRRPLNSDVKNDSNCNGINGTDSSGLSYEDLYCKNSDPRGILLLGDSVGAHFHAPEEWFTPSLLTKASLEDLPFVIENEGDWPQLSGTTGYMNSTWNITRGTTDSIYLKMRQRNRCNHRDFQNLAVNGCNSTGLPYFTKSTSRNKTADYPLLIFIELVGNDVCNHLPDTLGNMTTPKQMFSNIMSTLQYLDGVVPPNSHMLLVGMADGRFLYNTLHNRLHPIGKLHRDVTYKNMYDWWECMQVTPCMGWLSSNETLRNLTSKRAAELSAVLKQIATKYASQFKNFDVNYLDCPLQPVVDAWEKEHGPGSAWQLIEPVDGFHPNQMGQALTAEYAWRYLENNLPHYIGGINDYNADIVKLFGDQGGY